MLVWGGVSPVGQCTGDVANDWLKIMSIPSYQAEARAAFLLLDSTQGKEGEGEGWPLLPPHRGGEHT